MVDETSEQEPVQEEGAKEEVKEESSEETSPLEEVRNLNKNTEQLLKNIQEERKKFEKAVAEMSIQGRSISQPKTQEEKKTPKDYGKRVMGGHID